MAKLNQIIAVVNGKKNETQKDLTEVYRKSGTPELFAGLSRIYAPKEDGGEVLPSEGKKVQYTVKEAVDDFGKALSGLLDVVATQETANTIIEGSV